MGKQVISLKDNDREPGTVTLDCVDITAVNEVEITGYMDDFLAAIEGVTVGLITKDMRVMSDTVLSGSPYAVDKTAQREVKWLVQMHETTTFDKQRFTIPCADMSLLSDVHDGRMDVTSPEYLALYTAASEMKSSIPGEDWVIDDITLLGANL